MKAYEVMNLLYGYGADADYSNTCDTLKAGNPDNEVTKVAVSMFATIGVVKAAKEWGAQLLVVHEPTYYNHMDHHSDEKIECEKRVFLENSGLAIYRFHDHPHYNHPDMIAVGEWKYMGFEGETIYGDLFGHSEFILKEPMAPVEIAKQIESKLGIKHVRICGNRNTPVTKMSGMFGTPGNVFEKLKAAETEVVLTGEACEWMLGEYARDAADLGYAKTLMILGHIGSERDGMVYVSEVLTDRCPELEVKYFECGEVYTYTDTE